MPQLPSVSDFSYSDSASFGGTARFCSGSGSSAERTSCRRRPTGCWRLCPSSVTWPNFVGRWVADLVAAGRCLRFVGCLVKLHCKLFPGELIVVLVQVLASLKFFPGQSTWQVKWDCQNKLVVVPPK